MYILFSKYSYFKFLFNELSLSYPIHFNEACKIHFFLRENMCWKSHKHP
jgi:hypothetical protein